ncbi:MAG TPA: S26 family signal peptidase [Halobacteria archaeon]|nr:S26 family signal peptidase [Halobacteria archaeon]
MRRRDRDDTKERGFFSRLAMSILGVLSCLLLIFGIFYIATGLVTPFVAVQGSSMEPNIHEGDLIIMVSIDRYGDPIPYIDGRETGYEMFGNYGDVIIYRPDGNNDRSPIIHRAIAHLGKGDNLFITIDGDVYVFNDMPYDGYLTKGDNKATNHMFDQPFISKPVKKEWIIGKAKFRIPYLGYLSIIPRKIVSESFFNLPLMI